MADERTPLTVPSAPPPYAPPQPTTTVIIQPEVVQQVQLRDYPVQMVCPTGGHPITTNIHYEPGTLTWLVAILLCVFLGPCCALIPCCINDMKDVVHTCPIDGTVIGVYKRM